MKQIAPDLRWKTDVVFPDAQPDIVTQQVKEHLELATTDRVRMIQSYVDQPVSCEDALQIAMRNLERSIIETGTVITHDDLGSVVADPNPVEAQVR